MAAPSIHAHSLTYTTPRVFFCAADQQFLEPLPLGLADFKTLVAKDFPTCVLSSALHMSDRCPVCMLRWHVLSREEALTHTL